MKSIFWHLEEKLLKNRRKIFIRVSKYLCMIRGLCPYTGFPTGPMNKVSLDVRVRCCGPPWLHACVTHWIAQFQIRLVL